MLFFSFSEISVVPGCCSPPPNPSTKSRSSVFPTMMTLQNSSNSNNVMFSLWFFRWLCSSFDDYKPHHFSLNLLFGALLDARAVKAAKGFLGSIKFNPEATLLERYVKCLCEDVLLVDEGIRVTQLKESGTVPSVATCNAVQEGFETRA
ncbi:hypothetical protein Bca101_010862 [Brassica carinata]